VLARESTRRQRANDRATQSLRHSHGVSVLAESRADTTACTIAPMHKQLGGRRLRRSDAIRVASASWRTWLLHAYCSSATSPAAGGRSSGKPAVPAAAAPAAPFTRKHQGPVRPDRDESASGRRAASCQDAVRAGADRCARIWAIAQVRWPRRRQQPQLLPLHSCSSPTCPAFSVLALKVIDSSMVSVSPDVDREGRSG
jgi:hypothetical protein